MSINSRTCVIIPNWDGMPFVEDCLKSLINQTVSHDIIVVDNGSTDNSIETIEKNFPDVILIKLDHNTGYTGGVNTGLKYAIDAGYDFAALFNNDATADRYWLEHLVSVLNENQAIGVATCKLLNADKKHFDSSGDFYTIHGIAYPRGRNQIDNGQYDKPETVFGATGGASLYRLKMLKQIGLMDDFFFAYFEDVELSFRANLAGWEVYYQPGAIAYHSISATSGRLGSFSRYHSVKNLPIVYLKTMPAWLFWKYLPLFSYRMTRQLVASTIKGLLLTHLKANFATFKHLPVALKQRRQIQKNRRLTTAQVDRLLVHSLPPKIPNL